MEENLQDTSVSLELLDITPKTRSKVRTSNKLDLIKIKNFLSRPVWLSWLECCPVTKRWQVQFLGRARTYVAGSIPGPGEYRMQPIDVSLSLSLPLFLKAMKKCPWVRIKKKD